MELQAADSGSLGLALQAGASLNMLPGQWLSHLLTGSHTPCPRSMTQDDISDCQNRESTQAAEKQPCCSLGTPPLGAEGLRWQQEATTLRKVYRAEKEPSLGQEG